MRIPCLTALAIAAAALFLLSSSQAHAALAKHKAKQPAGGANQVEGAHGKVGQMVSDGQWYFEVVSGPNQTDRYVAKSATAGPANGAPGCYWNSLVHPTVYTPLPGYTLVTFDCIVKNRQATARVLDCSWPNLDTGLTDDMEEDFQPVGYDMEGDDMLVTKRLAPGASEPMTLIFAVPENTHFQYLVFSLHNQGESTWRNARISLGGTGQSGGGSGMPAGVPVSGLSGKIGDVFFDGRWRFEALSAPTKTDKYIMKIESAEERLPNPQMAYWDSIDTPRYYTPKPGYTLYTIDCLAKNGQTTVQQLDCGGPGMDTSLIDDKGQSYPVEGFDMMTNGDWTTRRLLPGSAERITVVFALPQDSAPKTLIFTLRNSGDAVSKNRDVHVALSN